MNLLKIRINGVEKLVKYEPYESIKIDGRKYRIVQIGRQWWMAENLALPIGNTYSPLDGKYGLLYEYSSMADAISDYMPTGWKIPEKPELDALITFLGSNGTDWFLPEFDGTNSTKFGLAGTGYVNSDNNYIDNGRAYLWSSTSYSATANVNLYATGSVVGTDDYSNTKNSKLPLRLCKDATVNIGGRDYPTTRIGNQVWLAENLDLKWDGLNVGESGTSSEEPRANYYNNDESTYGVTGNKYGLLYNWQAANYLDEHRAQLLPKGWRVPSTSDWNVLANEIGGMNTAGIKLRSSTGWSYINGIAGGTDNYGFTSIPSGAYDGNSVNADWCSMYWGTTLVTDDMANNFIIDRQQPLIVGEGYLYGQFSIRLVKDAT